MSLNHIWPALICTLFLCSQCGENGDRTFQRDSSVTIAHPGLDGRGFNPAVTDEARYLAFLPLVTLDENGKLEGWLAESWEYSADFQEVTYHLRTDVTWHDDVPVTAHDVKFSMELMVHPDVVEENLGFFGSVTVIDDSTLRIRGGSQGVDEVYWPKHLLEHLDPKEFDQWDFWKAPVGNGPYRFVRYVPYTLMEFEANPNYFRRRPEVDRATLKFTGNAGMRELLSGNVDVVVDASPLDVLQLKGDPRFDVYHQYDGWWLQQVIYWQHGHPLFQGPEVRRALTMTIDRREILRLLDLPRDVPLVDGPYSLDQFVRTEFPEPQSDLAAATLLLEGGGWHDTDRNGVRDKDGVPFRFTTLVGSYPSYNMQLAVYVQNQFRKVGVEMGIQAMETIVVMDRIQSGKFEAVLGTFWSWCPFFEAIGYESPELKRLGEFFNQSPNRYFPEEQGQAFQDVQEAFRRDAPVTFLIPRIQTSFVDRRITGLRTPWRANPLLHMEYVRLRDDDR